MVQIYPQITQILKKIVNYGTGDQTSVPETLAAIKNPALILVVQKRDF
jgi:hypothetical protein